MGLGLSQIRGRGAGKKNTLYVVFMPIIIYYPKGFEVRTSLEGWTSCCKNYIHGLRFFTSPDKKQRQSSSRDARDREVSWLLTRSSLGCKKNSIGEDFSELKKKESRSRDSRDREVSWLLTSSSLEARKGLSQRTPGEED